MFIIRVCNTLEKIIFNVRRYHVIAMNRWKGHRSKWTKSCESGKSIAIKIKSLDVIIFRHVSVYAEAMIVGFRWSAKTKQHRPCRSSLVVLLPVGCSSSSRTWSPRFCPRTLYRRPWWSGLRGWVNIYIFFFLPNFILI